MHLTLNSQTEVAIDFSTQARIINLHQGEIILDSSVIYAKHLPPVTVHFSGQVLTLTSDNPGKVMISNYDTCMIAVANGQVSLANSERNLVIEKGQQWQLTAQQIWQQTQLNYQPMAWIKGLLIADNMRLDQLLAYLNRYHYAYIYLSDSLAAVKVSGVYHQ